MKEKAGREENDKCGAEEWIKTSEELPVREEKEINRKEMG